MSTSDRPSLGRLNSSLLSVLRVLSRIADLRLANDADSAVAGTYLSLCWKTILTVLMNSGRPVRSVTSFGSPPQGELTGANRKRALEPYCHIRLNSISKAFLHDLSILAIPSLRRRSSAAAAAAAPILLLPKASFSNREMPFPSFGRGPPEGFVLERFRYFQFSTRDRLTHSH